MYADLASGIARNNAYLVDKTDEYGRTALQLLASNSLAFDQTRRRTYLSRIFDRCMIISSLCVCVRVFFSISFNDLQCTSLFLF